MIDVSRLVKQFPPRIAVDDVSFHVSRGETLGFLGPNGSGKTTTMRMIAGFLRPDSGEVRIGGLDPQIRPVEARRLIGYLPENAPAYENMTVEEYLRFVAEVRGARGAELRRQVDEAIERCLLSSVRRQMIETLSRGYRQRTCFAQAVLHDPPVLILDEPTEGLDPNQKQVVRGMMSRMGRDKAILLSTHILDEVEAICSRLIIICSGRLVADGTPTQLKATDESHQRVEWTVDSNAEEIQRIVSGIRNIRRVDILGREEEGVRMTAWAVAGQPIHDNILRESSARGWALKNLRIHEGRLDVVFERLTRNDPPG